MIAVYGFAYREVMEMPVERFWIFHRNIDRIRAEQDIRTAQILTHITTSESYLALGEALDKQLDRPYVFDADAEIASPQHAEQLDRDGLNALRGMGSFA